MANRKRKKCKYCGKSMYSDTAYVHTSYDDKKVFYCSEEHYKLFVKVREIKYNIATSCNCIFDTRISNYPLYKKKINEIEGNGELDTADKYIKENILELSMALELKGFTRIDYKIIYFFEIVRRGIEQYNELIKIAEKSEKLEREMEIIEEVKFVPRKKRRNIMDVVDSLV